MFVVDFSPAPLRGTTKQTNEKTIGLGSINFPDHGKRPGKKLSLGKIILWKRVHDPMLSVIYGPITPRRSYRQYLVWLQLAIDQPTSGTYSCAQQAASCPGQPPPSCPSTYCWLLPRAQRHPRPVRCVNPVPKKSRTRAMRYTCLLQRTHAH